MGLVMCDIDGCVADVRSLVVQYLPNWDEYFAHQYECDVIGEVVKVVKNLKPLFYTGRPEWVRDVTEWWLAENVTRDHQGLLMRPNSAVCSTQELKLQWFKHYMPVLVIDDDPLVVDAARKIGITVLQIHGFRWSGKRDYAPYEIVPKLLDDGVFSFVENSARRQTPEETLAIVTYELGHVVEYNHKARVYGPTGYYSDANQQKEMSDFISMARMYCEQKGWNYESLKMFGEVAYLERMEDIRKHGTEEQGTKG